MTKNDYLNVGSLSGAMALASLLAVFLFSIPFGAIFGYLFGTLTAGGFWLVDWYETRQSARSQ